MSDNIKIKSIVKILSAFIVTIGLFSNLFYSSMYIKYAITILCALNFIMSLFEIKSSKYLSQKITLLIPLIIMIVILVVYK